MPFETSTGVVLGSETVGPFDTTVGTANSNSSLIDAAKTVAENIKVPVSLNKDDVNPFGTGTLAPTGHEAFVDAVSAPPPPPPPPVFSIDGRTDFNGLSTESSKQGDSSYVDLDSLGLSTPNNPKVYSSGTYKEPQRPSEGPGYFLWIIIFLICAIIYKRFRK